MATLSRIAPCLWFDGRAEEAARFYTGIFADSRIVRTTRYGKAGHEQHGMAPGSVLTVVFELDGMTFTALNGPPLFKFTEAVSFQVMCETQDEIDHYWVRLGAGGDPAAQRCGWLKDHFGLSWQVVPSMLPALLSDPARSEPVMQALLAMTKLEIATLQQAARAQSRQPSRASSPGGTAA